MVPIQVFALKEEQNQREQKGEAVRDRTGPEHSIHPEKQRQQQRRRNEKDDLPRQREDRRFDRFAHRLQIGRGNGLKPGQWAEQRKMRNALTANSLYSPSSEPNSETTVIGEN